MEKRPVIFTDLDGTLIDFEDYSFSESHAAVKALQEAGVPIVFCSSKTRAEQEYYLDALEVTAPFIVENGSAIFIPKRYFKVEIPKAEHYNDKYDIIKLGIDYSEIRLILEELREQLGIDALGYGDLNLKEIEEIIKLDEEFSKRAATREFSETILNLGEGVERLNLLRQRLNEREVSCLSGGKFHTVISEHADKGKAVKILSEIFEAEFGEEIISVGIGDSANDAPLLEAVEYPYQVQKPPGKFSQLGNFKIRKIQKIGPAGWNQMAKEVQEMFCQTV